MDQLKKMLGRCRGSIMAAVAVSFLLFLYGPLELYFTNRADFWFSTGVLLRQCALLFVCTAAVLVALQALAAKFFPKLYPLALGGLLWGLIVCYVQNSFLSGGLPSLNGEAVNWNAYPGQRAASAILCVAAAVLVIFLARKKWLNNAAFFGGGALTLMLAITVVTLGLGSSGDSASYYYSGSEKLQEYSSDKNFVIFVLDTVDGDTFEQLVDETPEYKEALRDFTYYSDTLCAYPYTYYAVPQLLSGEWYEGGEDFEAYRARALRESPLFKTLEQQNYSMAIYLEDKLLNENAAPERFFNMHSEAPKIASQAKFCHVILQMSGLKNAPFDLKRFCYTMPDNLSALKVSTEYDENSWYSWYNIPFLQSCQAADSSLNPAAAQEPCSEKMFKYIHVAGAHVPYKFGPHLEVIEGTPEASYKNNVAGSIYLIEAYLDMLRHNGTYDNTAIAIMSDHGYAEDENGAEINPGRQHSIFLAKGFGESHEYAVNEAPFSYDDLQTAYARLLGGSPAGQLCDYKAGDARERRYLNYVHEFKGSEFSEMSGSGFIEMMQTGRADDLSTLQPTGVTYQPPKSMVGD